MSEPFAAKVHKHIQTHTHTVCYRSVGGAVQEGVEDMHVHRERVLYPLRYGAESSGFATPYTGTY